MTKSELVKSLRKCADGGAVITRSELARFLGIKNPRNVNRYLSGLQRISDKYYFIPEVADKLLENVSIDTH